VRDTPSQEVEPFRYDVVPTPAKQDRVILDASANVSEPTLESETVLAQGRQEGQAEARRVFEELLAKERANLAAALADFARDRSGYFAKVEAEIVQLSLAIARKILHREAQVDPLLLAGMVRVALQQIDGATEVVLRVHPQNAPEWQRYLGTHLDPADMPRIMEDPAQLLDQCTLQTSMGTTMIGLEVQLKEIERGLLDLLAARPGGAR
jgi:flagellar assembly protein FliH